MPQKLSIPAILVWTIALGCSNAASTPVAGSGNCVGPTCQSGEQDKDEYEIILGTAGAAGASASGLAGAALESLELPKLCSVEAPSCNPDDVRACAPLVTVGSAPIGKAAGGYAGALHAQGGVEAAAAGTGVAGSKPWVLACRVVRERDSVKPSTRCDPAGVGTLGAPCVSDANCAAGFSCVEETGTAQCRPYCCRGNDSCPSGTYCDVRPVKELEVSFDRIWVSVCMPGTSCRFDEPYPCPADRRCSCPTGKTCGAVRGDGMTACVTPGNGTEGEPCPCAANHVCAGALGSCLKVCDLTSLGTSCGEEGICQTSTNLPHPWGLCVSSAALL